MTNISSEIKNYKKVRIKCHQALCESREQNAAEFGLSDLKDNFQKKIRERWNDTRRCSKEFMLY